MKSASRRSLLQTRILLRLEQGPVRTISELAVAVDAQRPSVSRSLKTLRSDNLVERRRSGWKLTLPGQDDAKRCNQELYQVVDSLRRTYKAATAVEVMKDRNVISESLVGRAIAKNLSGFAHAPLGSVLDVFPKTLPQLFSPMPVNILAPTIAPLADTQRRLSKMYTHSIAPLADAQRGLSNVFAQSMALPHRGFIVSKNNAIISSAIESIQAVYSAPHIREQGIDKVFYPGVLRDFPGISTSYRMLLGESSTMAAATRDLTAMQQSWPRMLIPSSTVASFTHSLRSGVALRPEPNRETIPPLSDREDPPELLDLLLADLNPDLVDKWKGSWQALRDSNPDKLSQAAFSYRELIRMVLDELAPDVEVDSSEQGSKRKKQVRQVLDGREGDFAGAMVEGLPKLYDFLSKSAHTSYRNEVAVQAALMAGDGLLLILLSGRRGYDS